jgi:diguanylate cyclase (GGDEF)-like protein
MTSGRPALRGKNSMSDKVIRGGTLPLIGFVLIAGFLLTNILSYLVSSGALRTAIVEHELPLTGNNVYSEVEKDLVRPILVSSLMANDTFVQDWLGSGEIDRDAITRYLQRIRQEYNAFTAFLVSRETQAYYHFSAPPRHLSRDNPDYDWFFRMVDSPSPYEVNVDRNHQQNDVLTVFINYRVLDHTGRMIGLTGVGLDFSNVRNIVSRYRDQFDRNIYFVNKEGLIVVATDVDTPVGADITTLEGLRDVAGRVLAEDKGDYSFLRDGHRILLSQRYVPDLGWRVMVEQDEAKVLRPLWIGFLTNAAIGVVLIVVVLGIVGFAFGRHQSRIRQLLYVDRVTGLGSRQRLEADVEAARGRKGPVSLVLVDLDRFRLVNERYGRARGDEVLASFGGLVREAGEGALSIARYDGAAFVVLREEDAVAARRFGVRLVRAIGLQMLTTPDDGERVTASFGVAELARGESFDDLVDRAERALAGEKTADKGEGD